MREELPETGQSTKEDEKARFLRMMVPFQRSSGMNDFSGQKPSKPFRVPDIIIDPIIPSLET